MPKAWPWAAPATNVIGRTRPSRPIAPRNVSILIASSLLVCGVELPVATRQRTRGLRMRVRARDRIELAVHDKIHGDREAVVSYPGLPVVAVKHYEVDTFLSRVLHSQFPPPMRRAVPAVGVRSHLRKGDLGRVEVERTTVD